MKKHSMWDGHSPVPIGCTCGYHEATKMKAAEPSCPDYLHDLNDMHEAEKVLTFSQQDDYWKAIRKVCFRDHGGTANTEGCFFMASATQRAEAFLRTLRLWKE